MIPIPTLPWRWIAAGVVLIAVVLAVRWGYGRVERVGFERAEAAWRLKVANDTANAQETARLREQAARRREGELRQISNQVEVRYAQVKRQAASDAAAAGDELAALRGVLDARAQADAGRAGTGGATCPDPTAASRTDGGRAERDLLGQCASLAVGLAAQADRIDAKLRALQDWVREVVPGAK